MRAFALYQPFHQWKNTRNYVLDNYINQLLFMKLRTLATISLNTIFCIANVTSLPILLPPVHHLLCHHFYHPSLILS